MGSTLEEVGPLMRRTETVPPGGRWRAYLARSWSIPRGVVVVGGGVGGGRFRLVFAMVLKRKERQQTTELVEGERRAVEKSGNEIQDRENIYR